MHKSINGVEALPANLSVHSIYTAEAQIPRTASFSPVARHYSRLHQEPEVSLLRISWLAGAAQVPTLSQSVPGIVTDRHCYCGHPVAGGL
jgi:hypothetical protein